MNAFGAPNPLMGFPSFLTFTIFWSFHPAVSGWNEGFESRVCVCVSVHVCSIYGGRNGFSVSNVCAEETCKKEALDIH